MIPVAHAGTVVDFGSGLSDAYLYSGVILDLPTALISFLLAVLVGGIVILLLVNSLRK